MAALAKNCLKYLQAVRCFFNYDTGERYLSIEGLNVNTLNVMQNVSAFFCLRRQKNPFMVF
jgi:hypothetical protein